MRAKRVFEYDRGGDPKKGLRIGNYSPGELKDFEDVEPGDIAIDYSGEKWEVMDKISAKIDWDAKPINIFYPHISDPKVVQFLEQYDESGIMMDYLENGMVSDMDGETEDYIAVYNDGASVVFIYDDTGALVYW
jgi:hypothetical protein